jgi:hypothetical protein
MLIVVDVHPSGGKVVTEPPYEGGKHVVVNSLQCGGTNWPTGGITAVEEATAVTGFPAKNILTGLLVCRVFVSQLHVQSHPKEMLMSKRLGR